MEQQHQLLVAAVSRFNSPTEVFSDEDEKKREPAATDRDPTHLKIRAWERRAYNELLLDQYIQQAEATVDYAEQHRRGPDSVANLQEVIRHYTLRIKEEATQEKGSQEEVIVSVSDAVSHAKACLSSLNDLLKIRADQFRQVFECRGKVQCLQASMPSPLTEPFPPEGYDGAVQDIDTLVANAKTLANRATAIQARIQVINELIQSTIDQVTRFLDFADGYSKRTKRHR
jgi:hypothetical protein